jgi:molybdopterin converting factor subunit 1
MTVKILYFAQFCDLAEKESETLELQNNSPEALYASVRERYGFGHRFEEIQVAINHELCAHDAEIKDGDEVAFLPPMTGG